MSVKKMIPVVAALAIAAFIYAAVGRDATAPSRSTGYVAADTIYMAAPVSGEVGEMLVVRGQDVEVGTALFSLDTTVLDAQLAQVESDIREFRAKIEYAEAYVARAEDNLNIAQTEVERTAQDLRRYQDIWEKRPGAISPLNMDHTRLAATSAAMQRNAAAKERDGARANAAVAHSQAERALAQKVILQRTRAELAPHSPVQGRIEDILVQQGEWATANKPVVSIVPYGETRVRFYVTEKDLALYPLGSRLTVTWSGAAKPMGATVNYIAPKAEFTPPVIYSLETRDKLVFRIEAQPDEPRLLNSGQPLDIEKEHP